MKESTPPTTEQFSKLPKRLFLDSSTLQAMHSYGEFIYDGGDIAPWDRLWAVTNGPENIRALREIMFVGKRATYELVLSSHSLEEVAQRRSAAYLQWAFDIVEYWESLLAVYRESGVPAFRGHGIFTALELASPSFGYLSNKDRLLLSDALELECDAFITMDRKLLRNVAHFESRAPMRILEPVAYWDLLRPWAPLFV